ncbi:similar to leishmanolysin-like (metallopeptidase M8 family) (predicted), partial [Rattus norvegicus]
MLPAASWTQKTGPSLVPLSTVPNISAARASATTILSWLHCMNCCTLWVFLDSSS